MLESAPASRKHLIQSVKPFTVATSKGVFGLAEFTSAPAYGYNAKQNVNAYSNQISQEIR
jgi:hypothetical protein